MGLLIGRISENCAHLWAAQMVPRNDKRKDRVEISPELLVSVVDKAEHLGAEMGERVRVLGWYHSHPHITPYPSHVDLGSQAVYQTMEPNWVGLIFSVFNNKKSTQRGHATLHSFQTIVGPNGQHYHAKIPVRILPAHELCQRPPHPFDCPTHLVQLLLAEAKEAHTAASKDTSEVVKELLDHTFDQMLFKNVSIVVVEARKALSLEREALAAEISRLENELAGS